ncbi:MAG: DUF3052 family protein [Acidobacteriales bacterium]|nr:DUF3052 family protein [Terriglobales bacterium]
MPTAGYSGTPLVKKLGIKEDHSVALLNAPDSFRKTLGEIPPGVRFAAVAGSDHDLIHFFTKSRKELEKELPKLRKKIKQGGMIWISWPKKAGKVPTDITEDTVRDTALALDLVDVKVCAVDEVWSGLKLVIPVAKRKK